MLNDNRDFDWGVIMEVNEKLAYKYWEYLSIMKTIKRLKSKEIMTGEDVVQDVIIRTKKRLDLDESVEQLMDKRYQDKIERNYGRNIDDSPIPMYNAISKAKNAANIDPKYKSFTEIVVKSRLDITPSYALQSWLRSRNTIAFLSLWEEEYNSEFLVEEAKKIIAETEVKNSALTLKQWIPRTNAKGIVALQGRYGGTYAHSIIALDFGAWLSPARRFELFHLLPEFEKRI